jgi:hypothetical protein
VSGAYVGIPKPTDVAAQYRHHAQLIADGDLPRPVRAFLVEVDGEGTPHVREFGAPYTSRREVISDLLDVVTYLNSEAAN